MRSRDISIIRNSESVFTVNRVLRNTYFLLSLTLLFSAITAGYSVVSNAQPIGIVGLIVGMLVFIF